MNFPPYVPEVIRTLYRKDLEANSFSPESAKRMKLYILSPAMREVYGWLSNVVESDSDLELFYYLGLYVDGNTPKEIDKHREKTKYLRQLQVDATKTKNTLERMEQEITKLKSELEFINNQIEKCSEELEVNPLFDSEPSSPYNGELLSMAAGREKNRKTESIRFIASELHLLGFELTNPNMKKAIAVIAQILFDIDDDITYDDVRKTINTIPFSPYPY